MVSKVWTSSRGTPTKPACTAAAPCRRFCILSVSIIPCATALVVHWRISKKPCFIRKNALYALVWSACQNLKKKPKKKKDFFYSWKKIKNAFSERIGYKHRYRIYILYIPYTLRKSIFYFFSRAKKIFFFFFSVFFSGFGVCPTKPQCKARRPNQDSSRHADQTSVPAQGTSGTLKNLKKTLFYT